MLRMLPKARNKLAVMGNYARAAGKLPYKEVTPIPVFREMHPETYTAIEFEEGGTPANVIRFDGHKFLI